MLNTARKMFTAASRSSMRDACDLSIAGEVLRVERSAPKNSTSTSAITTLTSGPAIATSNSSLGFSGMRSSRATPPIGSRVTVGRRDAETRAP